MSNEPVAWMYDFRNPDNPAEFIRDWTTLDESEIERAGGVNVRPLYTRPVDDTALREWLEKTEWVQKTARAKELGMHRADVIRQRVEQDTALLRQALDALEYYRSGEDYQRTPASEAITALRERLEGKA